MFLRGSSPLNFGWFRTWSDHSSVTDGSLFLEWMGFPG
jgi:hypothetical protein